MSADDRSAAILAGALEFLDEQAARCPSSAWAEMRAYLRGQLPEAELGPVPRNIARAAIRLDVSEQTVRRWVHQICPDAKVGGRFRFTPEVWGALLNRKRDPFRAGGSP